MRKWMIGLVMAAMVGVYAGQALAEDAAAPAAGGDTQVAAQASEQGKAHAHHGKKKGHHKGHHGKGHKKA